MASTKVLIAYGSRYGCTEEISHELAGFLEEEGFQTQLLDLRTTREDQWPSIAEYHGVMIGTGIRIGYWTKEARKFLKRNKALFQGHKKALGVFVSCGYAADPKMYPKAKEEFIEPTLNKIGIESDLYDAFGGVFDFSNSSKVGYLDKKILRWGARDLCMDIEFDSRNDYRNWDQIRIFSKEFTKIAKKNQVNSQVSI
ncbi:MAG: flavodoxin domain-containing protein [Candidatus Hodarchaeota archaeon]